MASALEGGTPGNQAGLNFNLQRPEDFRTSWLNSLPGLTRAISGWEEVHR